MSILITSLWNKQLNTLTEDQVEKLVTHQAMTMAGDRKDGETCNTYVRQVEFRPTGEKVYIFGVALFHDNGDTQIYIKNLPSFDAARDLQHEVSRIDGVAVSSQEEWNAVLNN